MRLTSPRQHPREAGFSLVELSIVLVILGLLVGGILGGQALIKSAELRSVTTEQAQWVTAVNSFKERYFQLPGDISNATAFWGAADTSAAGECAAPGTDVGTGTQTCNGNRDGWVDEDYEEVRFWQHLSNAGLISGDYTGVAGPAGLTHVVPGLNSPVSKFGNGVGWSTDDEDESLSDSSDFDGVYGHSFMIGSGRSSGEADGDVFTAEELWNIDTKIDDGKPGQGHFVAIDWGDCTDAATSADIDADYTLDNDEITCAAYFRQAY